MKKKLLIAIGIVFFVLIMAIAGMSFLIKSKTAGEDSGAEDTGLPRVSFTVDGYEVSSLPGYMEEMMIPSLRDGLVPVKGGELQVNIAKYGANVQKMIWEIYTLDGEECLQKEVVDDVKETQTITLSESNSAGKERMLKITLHVDEKDVYYYTRIKDAANTHYKACMDFAQSFHENTMSKEDLKALEKSLESDISYSNYTFNKVEIKSSVDYVSWGDMKPQRIGDIQWEIKECNKMYTSLQMKYSVKCEGDKEHEDKVYRVTEFFRVRLFDGKIYLLNYDRQMEEVFEAKGAVSENGILLGITSSDVEYKVSSNGNYVAFAPKGQLWIYDKEENQMIKAFGFADAKEKDIRYIHDEHDVKVISVDKKGNTTFVVSGYMNKGVHEGFVGVAVYYYDRETNVVEEKAFVSTRKGYELMREELGQLVYFSQKENILYVMQSGALYALNLVEDTREVLVRGLEDGQYCLSEDGSIIAYQTKGGKLHESDRIKVLKMKSGKSFMVKADEGEYVRPIGFIKSDFAYGILREGDHGKDSSGETIYPMYRLEIVNTKNKVVKDYEQSGIYISSVNAEDTMLTLERVKKSGNRYKAVAEDYITNNEEAKAENISVDSYAESIRKTVVYLKSAEALENTNPKIKKADWVEQGNVARITFEESDVKKGYYVYAYGQLQDIYENAGEAVKKANEMSGVVVTSKMSYVWERGNWDTLYEINEASGMKSSGDQLEACLEKILEREGKEADVEKELKNGTSPLKILSRYSGGEGIELTGCTLEEIQYTINQETPVLVLRGNDRAFLITGYTSEIVAYIDPADGDKHIVPRYTIEDIIEESGCRLLSYVK